ncbi:MAG: TIM barrel protein [Caldilineaceae bacterium]
MTLPVEGHPTGRRLAVSTWSLHRTLGRPPIYGPDTAQPAGRGRPMPCRCWTCPPNWPISGSARWRSATSRCRPPLGTWPTCALRWTVPTWNSGRCSSTAATSRTRSTAHATWRGSRSGCPWQRHWARNVRAVAGMQPPTPVTVDRSVTALRRIMDAAEQHGVHVMTENWHALMDGPDVVTEILDRLQGDVGLCFDFGNWRGPDKYADLAAIAPYADSCHAKCALDAAGTPDAADYARCLEIVDAAGFAGPYTLIYDGADADEWRGLAVEREMVAPFLLE